MLWWSWRVLPPRPIGNKFDDYRHISFKNFFSRKFYKRTKQTAAATLNLEALGGSPKTSNQMI